MSTIEQRLDVGDQYSTEETTVLPTSRGRCWRCNRRPASPTPAELCVPCRLYLLEEIDESDLLALPPAPRPTHSPTVGVRSATSTDTRRSVAPAPPAGRPSARVVVLVLLVLAGALMRQARARLRLPGGGRS